MEIDAIGMALYDAENQCAAQAARIADLEKHLEELRAFLSKSALPYREVAPLLGRVYEVLAREVSSYRA